MTSESVNNQLNSVGQQYGAGWDMGNSASPQDIALAVGLESMNTYDDMVTSYYAMVHQENIKMENLNNAMAAANSAAPSGTDSSTSSATFEYTDPSDPDAGPVTMKVSDYLDDQGISRPDDPDNKYDTDEWNTVVSNIKSELDSVSSMSQVDMMKLQSILNKQQQAQAAATSIMKKCDDANNDNIRKW